jgi:transcriptional regulator with XRE-family HTH domain
MSELKPPDVGAQVKTLRRERGLSMRALAQQCELSPNTISLIERRATSPSVSTLHRLATALQVPITAFFTEQADQVRVITSHPEDRPSSVSENVWLESLGSGLEDQALEPFVVTLKSGAGSGRKAIVHDGHELVYCLEGEMEYEIDEQVYQLQAGESLLFEAQLPHRWHNRGSDAAKFLLVFQTPGGGKAAERHFGADFAEDAQGQQ